MLKLEMGLWKFCRGFIFMVHGGDGRWLKERLRLGWRLRLAGKLFMSEDWRNTCLVGFRMTGRKG